MLQFILQVAHVLPGLRLRLTDDEHEAFLLDTEDRPERIRERDESRLARASEGNDAGKPVRQVFCYAEDIFLKLRNRVFHIVREVQMEEHQMALSRDSLSHGTIFGDCFERVVANRYRNYIVHGFKITFARVNACRTCSACAGESSSITFSEPSISTRVLYEG